MTMMPLKEPGESLYTYEYRLNLWLINESIFDTLTTVNPYQADMVRLLYKESGPNKDK